MKPLSSPPWMLLWEETVIITCELGQNENLFSNMQYSFIYKSEVFPVKLSVTISGHNFTQSINQNK